MKNKKISKIFQKSVDKYTDGCYYTITKRKQHKTQYKVSQLLKRRLIPLETKESNPQYESGNA